MRARTLMVVVPLVAASCAGPNGGGGGPLQPQSVSGPCQVKPFFFLAQRAAPTDLVVRNTGEACTFVLVNYATQTYLNAALVTVPASHGRATAGLVSGNFQVSVSYVPQRGYAGPDRFVVTIEPGGTGVTLNVTVQ